MMWLWWFGWIGGLWFVLLWVLSGLFSVRDWCCCGLLWILVLGFGDLWLLFANVIFWCVCFMGLEVCFYRG